MTGQYFGFLTKNLRKIIQYLKRLILSRVPLQSVRRNGREITVIWCIRYVHFDGTVNSTHHMNTSICMSAERLTRNVKPLVINKTDLKTLILYH